MRVEFDGFLFDGDERVVSKDGQPLHLTPKAFELLQFLIETRPRAVAKQELRDRLWPDVIVDEANLKNLVAEIRDALGERGRSVIRTVHRFGYAFHAAIPERIAVHARLLEGERVHALQAGENIVGRAAPCQVIVDFSGVSRRHARIRAEDGRYVLEDLGSKNGTWRNDERVREPVMLADGDRLRFGAVELTFRCVPPETTTLHSTPASSSGRR